jgi:hypothetical protein
MKSFNLTAFIFLSLFAMQIVSQESNKTKYYIYAGG